MASTDLYQKLTSINFTIKNVSPSRKTINLFGRRIKFGELVDLLAIPEISEDDIRSSLIKGELANKIRKNAIKIASTNINLIQFDSEQLAFINSASLSGLDLLGTSANGNGNLALDNIAALSAVNDVNLNNGAVYFTNDVKDSWRLDKFSISTVDGVTVASTLSGTGRWIRLNQAYPEWAAQSEWHIDPVSGSDTNSGDSLGASLKTWSEINRRIGINPLSGGTASFDPYFPGTKQINFYIYNDLLSSDILSVNFLTSDNYAFININGIPATVANGTFTTVTNTNPATNTQLSLYSAGVDLTAYVTGTHRIKVTSGAAQGLVFYPIKDLGSNTVRATDAIDYASFVSASPSPGDTFIVETVPVISKFQVLPLGGFVQLKDLQLGDTLNSNTLTSSGDLILRDCFILNLNYSAGGIKENYNCLVSSPVAFIQSYLSPFFFYGGGSLTTTLSGSYIIFSRFVFQDAPCVAYNGFISTFNLGVFDSYDSGIIIDDKAAMGTFTATYGSGNAAYGMQIVSGSVFTYSDVTKQTITGSGGDALIGGTVKLWSATPFINPANNAMAVIKA